MQKFKALVCSGSGNLYPAHLGCLQALNETDIMSSIECIAAVSGSSFSTFLWLVCSQLENPKQVFKAACIDFMSIGTDQAFSQLDFGLLFHRFGILSVEIFESHFMDVLRIYGKLDGKEGRFMPYLTFQELYEYTGKTFIIVASDPKTNKAKYFHHLDTPNVKVMNAVRFSMSVTGLFAMENNKNPDPFFKAKYHPYEWRYVDGALCDNFPIAYTSELMKIDPSEILGNFIHTSFGFDGTNLLSLFKSQSSWLLSCRIIPEGFHNNIIVFPFKKGENFFSRFTVQERSELLARSKQFTAKYLEEIESIA